MWEHKIITIIKLQPINLQINFPLFLISKKNYHYYKIMKAGIVEMGMRGGYELWTSVGLMQWRLSKNHCDLRHKLNHRRVAIFKIGLLAWNHGLLFCSWASHHLKCASIFFLYKTEREMHRRLSIKYQV